MSDSATAPRLPSGEALERAVSMFQQLRDIYGLDPTLAEDEAEIRAQLDAADITHPDILLARLIDAAVWADRRETEADDIRREVTARRDRYRARQSNIRVIIAQLLDALEIKSHRARYGAASLAPGPVSVLLTDAELVPDEYVRIERHIQWTPIRAAIEAGAEVPGAVLSNPGPVLRIRKL
jgi:hypothetical protein